MIVLGLSAGLPSLAAALPDAPDPLVVADSVPHALSPVVVSSTRMALSPLDTPASVSLVEGDALRADTLQINLSERLGGVPGLQIQNRQNYAQDLQVSIRGFGARSTFGVRGIRLYVDGIPATMPDGQGQTSNIAIGSADRVEVLRGPFSALYGNASGGVILVDTQDGQAPARVQASSAGGSDGTFRYGVKASGVTGVMPGELDYVVEATRFTTQGWRNHSGARKSLANVKLGLSLQSGGRLTLVANHVDLKAQDPLGLTRAQFEQAPRQAPLAEQYDTRKTVRQSQAGLVYERQVAVDHALRVMTYAGQRVMTQYQSIPPAAQANPRHAGGVIGLRRDYGGLDVRWTSRMALAGRPLTLVGGLAYDHLREARKGYENFTGPAATPTALGVKGALRRDETNTVSSTDPYLQLAWSFAPRWLLETGLRYTTVRFDARDHYVQGVNGDDSGDVRYRRLLPAAALRYTVSDDTRLYVSYGRGVETPTTNEVAYRPDGSAGLNLGLQPAVSSNVELGFKARLGAGLLALAVFRTDTRDEIVSAGSLNGRTSFRNGGRTRRDGWELGWNGRLVSHWQADLAYTWIRARYRDDLPGTAIRAGNRIPGIAAHMAYAALSWAPPQGWRAGAELRYAGRVAVNDANDDAAPGYVVAGLSTGFRWYTGSWEWDAYARVDNLLDRRYAGSVIVNEGNGRYFEPALGRNWSAGLSLAYAF